MVPRRGYDPRLPNYEFGTLTSELSGPSIYCCGVSLIDKTRYSGKIIILHLRRKGSLSGYKLPGGLKQNYSFSHIVYRANVFLQTDYNSEFS
jgi:hypothetical protein